jgi:hypothetical protein
MITLSLVGLIWAVVGIVFVWMIVHYGISQGKQRDVAKEFEAKEKDKQDRDGQNNRKVS